MCVCFYGNFMLICHIDGSIIKDMFNMLWWMDWIEEGCVCCSKSFFFFVWMYFVKKISLIYWQLIHWSSNYSYWWKKLLCTFFVFIKLNFITKNMSEICTTCLWTWIVFSWNQLALLNRTQLKHMYIDHFWECFLFVFLNGSNFEKYRF